jgi:flagellar biosynthesis/type III secretory pathway chaperone
MPHTRDPQTADALLAHLDAELACLESMCTVLEEEAGALRRLAVDEVLDATRDKERILLDQAALAKKRQARLHAVRPGASCLTEVRHGLPTELADQIAGRQTELRALAERVNEQHARNQRFAESAHELVGAQLKVVTRSHAGPRTTYGPAGNIETGTPRTGVDRRA